MSSSARRSAVSNKTTGTDSRPGSSSKKIPTASSRPESSNKTVAQHGVRNKSNSATVNEKRQLPDSDRRFAPSKAGNVDGKIKVLGQDAELTETEIWNMNGISSGKSTPLSSRSSTFRTPTPSKQISLQAVRRKEEKDDPLETIDWNDFVRPVSQNGERSDSMLDDRIPTPQLTDSEDSDRDSGMTMEDRLQLVEKRAQEMTSALSSHPLNDMEENLSKQLERVEIEREVHDRLERQGNEIVVNKERQNNENFREFGPKSPRCLVTDSEIVGAYSQTGGFSINPGTSSEPEPGTSSDVSFTVGARPKEIQGDSYSQKKTEAIEEIAGSSQFNDDTKSSSSGAKKNTVETVEESSSSDEDSDDENDLIGRKGKAPNELLMEFLDCMMKQEYTTAEKLCKMILIYEPNNEEALSFFPLIQEKIKQEEEEESDSDTGSDDGDTDDDDDDDDSDEDDEDDDENSSEDSEDDQDRVPDSGIVSAANSD